MALSPSSPHPVLYGECGYCNQTITNEDQYLPLECQKCHDYFHLSCLRGDRPPVLLGDQLFYFTCGLCDPLGLEHCFRPNLQWVHIIHLALYNLTVAEGGRKGFFRWNDDICGFIQQNWSRLMPQRKKTQSWHSTVAGILSVNCPAVFQSGQKQFGEHGWWALQKVAPPDARVILQTVDGREGRGLAKRTALAAAAPETVLKKQKMTESPAPEVPKPKQRPPQSIKVEQVQQSVPASPLQPPLPPVKAEPPSVVTYNSLTVRQETVLLEHLMRYQQNPVFPCSAKVNRLVRKLKVRCAQRNHGLDPFNLDEYLSTILATTIKYALDETKPFSEQAVPVQDMSAKEPSSSSSSPSSDDLPLYGVVGGNEHLDRITLIPVLSRALAPEVLRFEHCLVGGPDVHATVTSPYTTRVLKPFIFRSTELQPAKVLVMEELVNKVRQKKMGGVAEDVPPPYTQHSVDFCYFQSHHLPAVNSLISHFFWPVDLTECLQYPDFTVVVMYSKLVIGCGFMTPDVKVNEAYISFLVVHPDFARAGIAKLMLYHLIQTCLGKDVTLHVSVDNPAMILYQKFGFKAESYCLDFYEKYFPPDHYLSKHAYHMRLRK